MEGSIRKIIRIDEEKCDGCVPACAEGALQIIDGKAKLVSEIYCDGLGDCLGECPQGAISMEEREAKAFDEKAVQLHLADSDLSIPAEQNTGCPGLAARQIEPKPAGIQDESEQPRPVPSRLKNWPVQIHLMPVHAPYLKGAHLTIAADCVPFAFSDFHGRFIDGRVVLVGCPKLDDASAYVEKLSQIIRANDISEIEVPYMEVPCCGGLVRIIQAALAKSGKNTPVVLTRVGIDGNIQESREMVPTGTG